MNRQLREWNIWSNRNRGFYAGYRRSTHWKDLPEPEKQKAIKILKKEFDCYVFMYDLFRRLHQNEP